jgi:hypothetical protein
MLADPAARPIFKRSNDEYMHMAEALAGIEATKDKGSEVAKIVARPTGNTTEELDRIKRKSPKVADTLRQEIKDLNQKIATINACLDGIIKASGKGADGAIKALGEPKVTDLFVSYPERFLEVSKIAGEGTEIFFQALQSSKLLRIAFTNTFFIIRNELEDFRKVAGGEEANRYISGIMKSGIMENEGYRESPRKFISNLKSILEASGESRNDVMDSLCDKNFAKLYAENQETFVSLAKRVGGSTGSLFESMKNDPLTASKIIEDPKAFAKLFRENEQDTTRTFASFTLLAGK